MQEAYDRLAPQLSIYNALPGFRREQTRVYPLQTAQRTHRPARLTIYIHTLASHRKM
jgi:hypothetical protein